MCTTCQSLGERAQCCVYRDAQGRKLTPKEAFRQQSYVFHGRKPGKLKKVTSLPRLR